MRQLCVLVSVLLRILFGLRLVEVGADLAVYHFDVFDRALQLLRGFHLQLCGRLFGSSGSFFEFLLAFLPSPQLAFEIFDFSLYEVKLSENIIIFTLPLLALTVPCEDLLLLSNQLRSANRLFRSIGIIGLLFGEFLLLISSPADIEPLLVKLFLLLLQLCQLRTDADDLQEGVRLLFAGGFHELRKVDGELFHKAVEELLPALLAFWISDLEVAVLALALNHKAIVHYDLEARRDGAVSIHCL